MSQILSVGNVFHNKSGIKKEDNYSDVDSKSSSSEDEQINQKQVNNCQELIEHAEREREREKRKLQRLRKKPD